MLEADWQRDCYLLHIVQLCVFVCVFLWGCCSDFTVSCPSVTHWTCWVGCCVNVDEMFLLNDSLQPFQVSQGQAGHSISWFHYSNRPLLHHSRQLECVCVCVWLHMRGLLTTPLPSILITPCLAFVHVSPLSVCDLLPCYTSWQTDECSFDSFIASNLHRIISLVIHTDRKTHTHTPLRSHWVTKLVSEI